MRIFVFAVRDSAIGAFMNPFYASALGQAERNFRDAVNDSKSPLYKHPEDYELFQLGTFDDGTGLFEVGVPSSVCTAKSVFKGGDVSALSPVGLQN